MVYKTYEDYKDSNLNYVGLIPSNWETARVKHILDYNHHYPIGDGDHGSIKPDMYQDKGIPYIRVQNLSWGFNLNFENMVYISNFVNNQNRKSILKPKDILIAKTGGTVGKLAIIPPFIPQANTTSSVGKITINHDLFNYKYFSYLFLSSMFRHQIIEAASQKSAQPGFNIDDLIEFDILIPPQDEQNKIVNFLDKRTSIIDKNISKNKELIDLLEEEKIALIHHVVTKGINPDVELKKTNIPWAKNIPNHWTIFRGKNILIPLKRVVKPEDEIITCFRDGEVTLRSKRREEGFTMSDKEIGYQGIEINDLVVHGMDGFAGAIGISDSRGKGSPVLIVLNSDQNKKYLMYYLRNLAYNNVFLSLSTGIRVRSCDLRWEKLANLLYLIPPIDEQNEIADYLEDNISHINRIIDKIQNHINLLDEYKASLIYHVVTGKIDVRDEV